jgi:predicted N-acyltransferase
VIHSLHDIPQAEWDVLASGDIRASHGWLLGAQESMAPYAAPHHVVLRSGGRLVGAAVAFIYRDPGSSLDPDNLLLGRLAGPLNGCGISFRPALVCATPRLWGGRILGASPGAVLDALQQAAVDLGLPLHLPRVGEDEAELASQLRSRRFLETAQDPLARLDIEWPTFESYVKSLKRRDRKMPTKIRHEMAKATRDGVLVKEIDPAAYSARLHQLVDQHARRLNGSQAPFEADFLPRLKQRLGNQCVVYGALIGKELVGFVLMLRDEQAAFLPLVGIEDGHRSSFVYFNTAFFRPIGDAIGLSLKQLWFGSFLLPLKERRGCRILPTSLFYRAPTELGTQAMATWFALHRFWAIRFRFAAAHTLAARHEDAR